MCGGRAWKNGNGTARSELKSYAAGRLLPELKLIVARVISGHRHFEAPGRRPVLAKQSISPQVICAKTKRLASFQIYGCLAPPFPGKDGDEFVFLGCCPPKAHCICPAPEGRSTNWSDPQQPPLPPFGSATPFNQHGGTPGLVKP